MILQDSNSVFWSVTITDGGIIQTTPVTGLYTLTPQVLIDSSDNTLWTLSINTDGILIVTQGPAASYDMLAWMVMDPSVAATNHLAGVKLDGTTPANHLNTQQPANGNFYWVKGDSGFPWDIQLFDANNIYLSTTENGFASASAGKRFESTNGSIGFLGVPFAKRFMSIGDSVLSPEAARLQIYTACGVATTTNIGFVKCTLAGPFVETITGAGANLPANLNTIHIQYEWSLASGYAHQAGSTMETFTFEMPKALGGHGFGLVHWQTQNWNTGTSSYDAPNDATSYCTLVPGISSPLVNDPCPYGVFTSPATPVPPSSSGGVASIPLASTPSNIIWNLQLGGGVLQSTNPNIIPTPPPTPSPPVVSSGGGSSVGDTPTIPNCNGLPSCNDWITAFCGCPAVGTNCPSIAADPNTNIPYPPLSGTYQVAVINTSSVAPPGFYVPFPDDECAPVAALFNIPIVAGFHLQVPSEVKTLYIAMGMIGSTNGLPGPLCSACVPPPDPTCPGVDGDTVCDCVQDAFPHIPQSFAGVEFSVFNFNRGSYVSPFSGAFQSSSGGTNTSAFTGVPQLVDSLIENTPSVNCPVSASNLVYQETPFIKIPVANNFITYTGDVTGNSIGELPFYSPVPADFSSFSVSLHFTGTFAAKTTFVCNGDIAECEAITAITGSSFTVNQVGIGVFWPTSEQHGGSKKPRIYISS